MTFGAREFFFVGCGKVVRPHDPQVAAPFVMEIEKRISHTFRYAFRAKMRRMVRRSIYGYAIGTALIVDGFRRLNFAVIRDNNIVVVFLVLLVGLMTLVLTFLAGMAEKHVHREVYRRQNPHSPRRFGGCS